LLSLSLSLSHTHTHTHTQRCTHKELLLQKHQQKQFKGSKKVGENRGKKQQEKVFKGHAEKQVKLEKLMLGFGITRLEHLFRQTSVKGRIV
jgi:hypothetical protein